MTQLRKKLASLKHPTIEAIVEELFRFSSHEEAEEKLRSVSRAFTVSRAHSAPAQQLLVLWIRDFSVTQAESDEGYTGNFARVTCAAAGNKWSLRAEKLHLPLRNHPQRKYLTSAAHPNWGHPVLRRIRQGIVYPNAEEAHHALMQLHEQYSNASIPNKNKLHILIWARPEAAGDGKAPKPVQKYVLSLRALAEGGCMIDVALNQRKKLPPLTRKTGQGDKPVTGRFSTLVTIQRRRKNPKE